MATFRDILREAPRISSSEKIDLAHSLLQSAEEEEPDPEYERLWMEEIERRLRDYDEGKVKAISAEELFADMKTWLSESTSTRLTDEVLSPSELENRARWAAMTFKDLKHEALGLPCDDRLELAYFLLRDLADEGFEINWDKPEVIGSKGTPVPQ